MANKPGDPYGSDPTMVYGPDGQTPMTKTAWDQSGNAAATKSPFGDVAAPSYGPVSAAGYNWSTPNATTATYDGLITYGNGTPGNINNGLPGEVWNNAYAGMPGNYIDPSTGQIYEGQGYTGGDSYNSQNFKEVNTQYNYNQDYGLGVPGVIPISRNAQGQATRFYAGTAGGGGQVFTDLASAQAAAQAYGTWYQGQHPTNTGTAQTGGTNNSGASGTAPGTTNPINPANDLTLPGAGETFNAQTTGNYTKPTNAQTVFDSTTNQPTEAEQYWNKYSGIFSNPNYLDSYYKTQMNEADNNLQGRLSAGGIADSSAGARATAGVPLQYAQAAMAGMQNFANTGMGLATSADTQRNAASNANNQKIQTAGGVDSTNLQQLQAGQNAADAAQTLQQGRINGGITTATQLGSAEASTAMSGLTQQQQQSLTTSLAGIQAKVSSGQMTAQAAYAQAQALMQGLGTLGSAAGNMSLINKLTGQPITAANAASVPVTDWSFGGTSPFGG